MKRKILTLLTFCFFLFNLFWTSPIWAFPRIIDFDCSGRWYHTYGVGATVPLNNHKSDYVNTSPGWPPDFYKQKDVSAAPIFTFGFGYYLAFTNRFLPYASLGISYTYAGPYKAHGHIEQYSLPQFRNYSYSYEIQRQTLLMVMKADLINEYAFMPYLTIGLGASFNQARHFEESPLSNVTPRISPNFHRATNVAFSYTVGLGVDYIVQDNILLSLEYYYGSFGTAHTGDSSHHSTPTSTNSSNDHLNNKLTANTILLNVTFVIEQI